MWMFRTLIALPAVLTLALSMGTFATAASAAEAEARPASCSANQALHINLPGDTLRQLAAACGDGPVSRLFNNRAYTSDIEHDYQTYLQLIPYQRAGSRDQVDYYAYRMFLGLAEAFAPKAAETSAARVEWLNQAYEQANELAELRMKGYDRLADRRAREMQARDSEL